MSTIIELTAAEVAVILKLKPDTVRKHVQRGLLRPSRKVGQAYLFTSSEVRRFQKDRKKPGRS
jgi:excisionase family DNA binding protein